MGTSLRPNFHRTLVALAAALAGVAICVSRQHVRIVLDDRATYASPLQHRCGQLMLACLAWAVIESAFYLRPAAPRRA